MGANGCLPCNPGTASNIYGTQDACGQCLTNYFAPNSNMVTCNICTALKCDPGFAVVPCSTTKDSYCDKCPEIANCVYVNANGCTHTDGLPTCFCAAGFEWVGGVGGKCQSCAIGFFKLNTNNEKCISWNIDPCVNNLYLANGTAYVNAQCIPCPPPPPNAVSTGHQCGWTCNAGFDNNV